MCYFNDVRLSKEQYIRLKDMEKSIAHLAHLIRPLQDGFTFQDTICLVANEDKTGFETIGMEWGFIPSYIPNRAEAEKMRRGYKDAAGQWVRPYDMQNAKGEELLLPKKVYRNAALKRRCLILSSGFYEWRELPKIGKKGQQLMTMENFPYYIYLENKPYFFFAGIWQPWTDKETGEHVNTFSLVTTEANALMQTIHNKKKRMPVILPELLAFEWLTADLSEERLTCLAIHQLPYEDMRAYTISKTFKIDEDPTLPVYQPSVPAIEINGIRYDRDLAPAG